MLDFLLETALGDIPAEVRADGVMSLMDTVGCILGGSTAAPVKALASKIARENGKAAVLGTPHRSSPTYAALIGAIAGAWLDLDSGHRHPSSDPPIPAIQPPVHLVPVLLAVGEQVGLSGADLLRCYVLSYEFTARLGIATRLRSGLHGHGLQPAAGCGVAAALALGFGRDHLGRTLRLAASLCLMGPMQVALDGGTARNALAGLGAANGILASQLARIGMYPAGDPISDVFRGAASDHFDPEMLIDGLGRRWESTLGYYKVHACCRWNHPALDALEDMAPIPSTSPDSVERVEICTFKFAAGISNPDPRTELGAKFSLPFAVAAFLVLGSAGFRSFSEEALWREDIRALARRVAVHEDPEFTAALPKRRPTTVRVLWHDGTVRTSTVQGSRGDPGNRFAPGVMEGKFVELGSPALGPDRARLALDWLLHLEEQPSITKLVDLLVPSNENQRF